MGIRWGRDGGECPGLTLIFGVTGILTSTNQCEVVAAKQHFHVTDGAIAKVCRWV